MEVRMAACFNRKHKKLRRLVTVQLLEPGFESGKLIDGRFEQQKSLCRRFNLVMPAVNGMNGWKERGTGGQTLLYERAAQPGAFLGADNGGHNDASGRRTFEHKAPPQ